MALPVLVLLAMVTTTVFANTSPFPQSFHPTSHIYTISELDRTPTELLLLDSLSGFLARTAPSLYRISDSKSWRNNTQDSYSVWLLEMEKDGVTVNDTLATSNVSSIIQQLTSSTQDSLSYLLCDASTNSVSAALTLAAASDTLLLVAGDNTTAAALHSIGATLTQDLRGSSIDKILSSKVLANLSTTVFVFQNPSKSKFLGDWTIFARAPNMVWNASCPAQKMV